MVMAMRYRAFVVCLLGFLSSCSRLGEEPLSVLSTVVISNTVMPKYACGHIFSTNEVVKLKEQNVVIPDVVLRTDYSLTNWIYSTSRIESLKRFKLDDMISITPYDSITDSNLYFIAINQRPLAYVKMTAPSLKNSNHPPDPN